MLKEVFSHRGKQPVISVSPSPSCQVRHDGIHHNESFMGGRRFFQRSKALNYYKPSANCLLAFCSGCCRNPDEKEFQHFRYIKKAFSVEYSERASGRAEPGPPKTISMMGGGTGEDPV